MGQNYFFGCISFNLKVIWPNLVRSEILDLGTLDLETAVPPLPSFRYFSPPLHPASDMSVPPQWGPSWFSYNCLVPNVVMVISFQKVWLGKMPKNPEEGGGHNVKYGGIRA